MSEIFITSDHHFLHGNIIKYCNRPFSDVTQMTEVMIKIWNEHITKDDYVIHLGDLILGRRRERQYELAEEIIKNLNGRKYLILGNHDGFPKWFYREMGIPAMNYFHDGKFLFSHHQVVEEIKYPSKSVKRAKLYADKNHCKYVIHGHQHIDKKHKNHFNVCVDLHNFRPINIKEIEDYFNGWKRSNNK